jgi:hypothetical protein
MEHFAGNEVHSPAAAGKKIFKANILNKNRQHAKA